MRYHWLLTGLLCCALALTTFPVAARSPQPVADYRSALEALQKGRREQAESLLRRGSDPVLNKVLRSQLMELPGNNYSFGELSAFISDNPNWPDLKAILMIAEQKIPDQATSAQVANWFKAHPPLTSVGFYRYIDALDSLGETRNIKELVRARWINANLGRDELSAFRDRFGRFLTAEDHWARLDRLLWDNDISDARAMYSLVGNGARAVAEARIALANDTSNASSLLADVPDSLQDDPGLLYERLRWRRKNDQDQGAIDLLLNAPENLGDADKWWTERAIIIRRVIEQRNFKLAYRLAANHGLTRGMNYVSAEFLAGWLALRKLKNAETAQQHFENLVREASSPISRARGAYWLGLALESGGDKTAANQSYETAAVLNTTFYGQLAAVRLQGKPMLTAQPEPAIPSETRQQFFASDMVRAVERLSRLNLDNMAETFFRANIAAAERRVEFALLIELAYQLDRPDWAITAAKAANQKNMIMRAGAYPLITHRIPKNPDPAFTHALIRQESQFKADALSPAGARGLMQVLPSTAKEVAGKEGMAYSLAKLNNPDYNIQIGTAFMRRLLDRYDGSYILALAAYNAGPGRVREWLDIYGDPRTGEVDPIDWLEQIPIYETRNYVQRIMENFQIYRARLNGGQHPLLLVADLKR